MKDYKDKKIIILTHILTTVPAEDLKLFFLNHQPESLLFIGHPIFYKANRPGSVYKLYHNEKLAKIIQYKNVKLPSTIQYVKDILLSLFWIIKTGKKWDLIISLDNLNTCVGLILREIGLIRKVIYYTIDFTPRRFKNRLLNNFYHTLDKICVKNADLTWNISPRIAEGREKIRNLKKAYYNKQITVPVGVWLPRISKRKFEEIEPHTLVYAGGLSKHQGVQVVLDALPRIISEIPDFKFLIIGLGDFDKELIRKTKSLKIEEAVSFLGYFEKHENVEEILSRCGLAVAMYDEKIAKWSYYCDPSKIKSYLAAGLPVITTSLTYIASELVENNCGIVVEYNKEKLASAIIEIMKNPKKHENLRVNAFKFIRDLDWEKIFNYGLNKIIL